MPFLRFKGFDEERVRQMTPSVIEEFSRVAGVPQEVVKVELLSIRQITATPRSLEIYMFERDREKHDAIAATLHALMLHRGFEGVHIFFVLLTPALYYKEGAPLQTLPWLP